MNSKTKLELFKKLHKNMILISLAQKRDIALARPTYLSIKLRSHFFMNHRKERKNISVLYF